MANEQFVTVCLCPGCGRVYRQSTAHPWQGLSRAVRRCQTALRALCEGAGQGTRKYGWVGWAWCAECSARRACPVLSPVLQAWTNKGEEKCG